MNYTDEHVKKASNAQCRNCAGALYFEPKTGCLKCPNCDSEFLINRCSRAINKHILTSDASAYSYEVWKSENKIFKCRTCGASIAMNPLEISQVCPYCASNYVSESQEIKGTKPDNIIPFCFDELEASNKFREAVKKKVFAPRTFKKNLPENKIHGVYFPSFIFDCDTQSTYVGELEKEVRRTVQTKDGPRTQIEHKRYRISGSNNLNFRDLIIEASSQLDDKKLRSILPYDLNGGYQFDEDYIRGYVVESYEDDANKCFDTMAKPKMKASIREDILRRYDYSSVVSLSINTSYYNQAFIYEYLPLYTFEFAYKKKNYIAVMNGQTGKMGRGIPISGLKVFLLVFTIVVVVVGLIILNNLNNF